MAEWKRQEGQETVFRTCAWSPPGCHPVGCGLQVHVEDGKVVKVEGDPEHPITKGSLCPRCLALTEYIYHPDRIIHPMKRAREDRGLDKWEQCSWDEATDLVANAALEITEKYGAETICVFGGTGREANNWYPQWANLVFGTPNSIYAQAGWSCYGPRMSNTAFMIGGGYPEIDYAQKFDDRYDHEGWVPPEVIVLWGKEPLRSNPDGLYGHAIVEMMRKFGAKLVCVDPRITWIGTRAEEVLRCVPAPTPRWLWPGSTSWPRRTSSTTTSSTSGATATTSWYSASRRCLLRAPRRSVAFPRSKYGVRRACTARRSRAASPGVWPWTRTRTARSWANASSHSCPSPASSTRRAARRWAWATTRATSCATAAPSTRRKKWTTKRTPLMLALKHGIMTQETWDTKRIGIDKYPAVGSVMWTAHPDEFLKALETEKPFKIHMAQFVSSNPVGTAIAAEPQRWYKALKKLDFNFACDLFMNPTIMACCDVFLPVASTIEHDGMVVTHYGLNSCYGAQNKCVQVGECKSDVEIMMMVGKEHPEFWARFETQKDYDDFHVMRSWLPFDTLREEVVHMSNEPYYKYAIGKLRPDGQLGFPTSTGRIELYSYMYANWGEDPLPYYSRRPTVPPRTCPKWRRNTPS